MFKSKISHIQLGYEIPKPNDRQIYEFTNDTKSMTSSVASKYAGLPDIVLPNKAKY